MKTFNILGKVATDRVLIFLFVAFMACEQKVGDTAKENTDLKQKLSGTWELEVVNGNMYNHFEVTFKDDSLIWSDSVSAMDPPPGKNALIQTKKGSCPVKYTFRDGIEHYNPDSIKTYSFTNFEENSILWVFENQYTENVYQDYVLENSVITKKAGYEGVPDRIWVRSSAVKFSVDGTTAFFCEPDEIRSCYGFTRKKNVDEGPK